MNHHVRVAESLLPTPERLSSVDLIKVIPDDEACK